MSFRLFIVAFLLFSQSVFGVTAHFGKLLDSYYQGAYPDVIKFGNPAHPDERRLVILSLFATGEYERAAILQGQRKDLEPMTSLIRAMRHFPDVSMSEVDSALSQLPSHTAKRLRARIFPPPPPPIRIPTPAIVTPPSQPQPDPIQAMRKERWQRAFSAIVSGNEDEALRTLSSETWNRGTQVDRLAQYWTALLLEKKDPDRSSQLLKKMMYDSPLGFYGMHIQKTFFPSEKLWGFKTKKIDIDPSIWRAYTYGLGEIKADKMTESIKTLSTRDQKEKAVYSLATLYSKMNMPHRSVAAIEKYGFGIASSNGVLLKPFAKLLFPRPQWEVVQEEGRKKGVDPYLILALMRQESLFNPNAKSRSGAVGYMQVLPSTGQGIAKKLRVPWQGASTLYHPIHNIQIGTDYLEYLGQEFHGNYAHMLSGYNGGPNATKRWLRKLQGAPSTPHDLTRFIASIPYSETHDYVMKVLRNYWVYQELYTDSRLVSTGPSSER
jgi:hypothetical protein